MNKGSPPAPESAPTDPKRRWDVDAQYSTPVGPDIAVDGAMAGINFAVRAWRWAAGHIRRALHRGS